MFIEQFSGSGLHNPDLLLFSVGPCALRALPSNGFTCHNILYKNLSCHLENSCCITQNVPEQIVSIENCLQCPYLSIITGEIEILVTKFK
jgi:hypothetical protein